VRRLQASPSASSDSRRRLSIRFPLNSGRDFSLSQIRVGVERAREGRQTVIGRRLAIEAEDPVRNWHLD